MSPAIALADVAKGYGIDKRSGPARLLGALRNRPQHHRREVLRDINLSVAHGEAVAILGRNGAGKSTLLKLIAGIGQPDSGTVEVNGRIGPLIELGAGFHSDENAITNIRTAATFMGAPAEDLDRIVDEALAFSGLADHVDKPIKYFSSGMVVRLGFAVIASVRPPILLSDEVLAVGDESFQKRCVAWLEGYLAGGGTLILVSHSIYHVQKLCARAIWVHQGQIAEDGDVFDVCQSYLAHHEVAGTAETTGGLEPRPPIADHLVVHANGQSGIASFPAGAKATLTGEFAAADVRVRLCRLDGTVLWESSRAGPCSAAIEVPTARLLPGRYALDLACPDHAFRSRRLMLQIEGASRRFGVYRLDHQWR